MIKKTCRVSGKEFEITDGDLDFYLKMEIISAEDYEKLKSREISDCIGLPTLCPEERQRRRLAWRNERSLYMRKCDGSGQNIISIHDGNNTYPIYGNDYFYSDNWSALDYGVDFDFSRSFFSQFADLYACVPQSAACNAANENSEYGNLASWNKDCYMCIEADNNRDCLYSTYSFRNVDCIDCTHTKESELCRYCVDCFKCYDVAYSFNSKNCVESFFLKNCIGCKNCFGCVNLKQKQYCWLNKQLTKEEYTKKLSQFNTGSFTTIQKAQKSFNSFAKKFPVKCMNGLKNENVLEDYLNSCKDSYYCYDAENLRDCKYCCNFERSKDGYDIDGYGGVEGTELTYENHTVGRGGFNIAFSNMIYQQGQNIFYSDTCINSSNLFGCISLKKNQYCILNKQYSKDEYLKLREKIIEHMKKTGEWGEFFSIAMSPFAYNETIANDYFPLNREGSVTKGYRWQDETSRNLLPATIEIIPENISDVADSICREILVCKRTGRNYQIQRAELKFYRKMNLPIPRRLHPDERHKDRMKLRNLRRLFERSCYDCKCKIQTTFSSDCTEKVLCETCYLKVVN